MFDKGTLTLAKVDPTNPASPALYDDVELTTPAGVNSGIAEEIYTISGNDSIRYKYYPSSGKFDFWGYFADDAVSGPVTNDGAVVKVPFTITGAQDLMVAKADTTTAQWNIIEGWSDKSRFYSSYAARNNVQPEMTFKHLLTRFTFSVVGNDNDVCGFNGGASLPASGIYSGVFVKSIKVKSKETGNIIAAYTGTAKPTKELIEFTGNPVMLPLSGEYDGTKVDSLYDQSVFTTSKWLDNDFMKGVLTIGGTHWAKIMRPTSSTTPTKVGGALLVQPLVTDGETTYDLEVEIGQYLVVKDEHPAPGTDPVHEIRYFKATNQITPTKVNGTTQGVSYNVKITLYGFEKIDVTTTLDQWLNGGEIPFDAD